MKRLWRVVYTQPLMWLLGAYLVQEIISRLAWDLVRLFHEARGQHLALLDASLRQRRNTILVGVCVITALCRVAAHHPVFLAGYRRWLSSTPWHAGESLPLGNVLPDLNDAMVVTAASFLGAFHSHGNAAGPLIAYCAAYVLLAGVALCAMGWLSFAYVFGFGFALAAARLEVEFDLSVLLILCAVLTAGTALSLRALSPNLEKQEKLLPQDGWPFQGVPPADETVRVPLVHAILASVLAGTWAYVLLGEAPRLQLTLYNIPLFSLVLTGPAVVRLLIYRSGHGPPLGFFARLFTGRWWMPEFDQIYVAPLGAILAARLIPCWFYQQEWPGAVGIAVTIGVVSFILLGTGPTLREWRLAGFHHNSTGWRTPKLIQASV